MPLTRHINSHSPLKPENLRVQTILVQMGTGGPSRPVTEAFIYDPSPMALGIRLSFPLAPGTLPSVYLRGLRMSVASEAGEGVDVTIFEDISRVTGEASFGVAFVGSDYPLAPGDRIVVDYWTAG